MLLDISILRPFMKVGLCFELVHRLSPDPPLRG